MLNNSITLGLKVVHLDSKIVVNDVETLMYTGIDFDAFDDEMPSRKKRIQVEVEDLYSSLDALATSERRSLSAMAKVLIEEALIARGLMRQPPEPSPVQSEDE
ncbi:MAG: hypothetical protein ACFBSC_18060 [Microcoleaceae cyanobacterium]